MRRGRDYCTGHTAVQLTPRRALIGRERTMLMVIALVAGARTAGVAVNAAAEARSEVARHSMVTRSDEGAGEKIARDPVPIV